jgi:hypothetical protein
LFKHYSQKSCHFECVLNQAIDQVGCLPWDYPVPPVKQSKVIPVCTAHQNRGDGKDILELFNAAMDNGSNLHHCDCMSDCEAVIYDSQERTNYYSPTNTELCHKSTIVFLVNCKCMAKNCIWLSPLNRLIMSLWFQASFARKRISHLSSH